MTALHFKTCWPQSVFKNLMKLWVRTFCCTCSVTAFLPLCYITTSQSTCTTTNISHHQEPSERNCKRPISSFQMCSPLIKLHTWLSDSLAKMADDEGWERKDLIKLHHGMSYCDSRDQDRGVCVCSVQLWIISTLFLLWPTCIERWIWEYAHMSAGLFF